MSGDRHKQLTRQLFERVWNMAAFDQLEALIDPQAQFHIHQQTVPMGPEETKQVIAAWHHAFPDFRMAIEAMAAENDVVAVRLALSGTHGGVWKGRPPTGRRVTITAMMFLRFARGRLVEIWEDFDELGLLRQLSIE